MAWELWHDSSSDSYGQIGFFCNTTDHSFGPVFMTDSDFDKGQFYKLWDSAGFKDPRSDDDNISLHTRHLLKMMSYDEKIVALIKVSRGDGINAPVTIHEESKKGYYEDFEFSPYKPALEALSEEDFDIVHDLIETSNLEMSEMLLIPDPNAIQKSTWNERDGFRVDMSWEVLDEY